MVACCHILSICFNVKKKEKKLHNDQMNSTVAVTNIIWIKIHEIILYKSPFGYQLF